MKVAILHDYLNQLGGAERVLEEFLALFPDAPIFTLFYDETRTQKKFSHRTIYTSFLQHIPFVIGHHRYAIPLMPFASDRLVVRDFDLVISSSSGYAKGFAVDPTIRHINYCYTPLRYAWEEYYLDTHKTYSWMKQALSPTLTSLKAWDMRASARPHEMYTISNYIAGKIERYYGKTVPVLYPPARTDFFRPTAQKEDFYLAAGRMLHYKRFDLVIEAFNRLGKPLKVIGSGPEYKNLKAMAGQTIEFLGNVSDETLRDYYSMSRALIFPQKEDFGLVAVEALSCGTPVIAFREGGGPQEIITEGENGLFFDEQSVESLVAAVRSFETNSFSPEACRGSAARFSPEEFRNGILGIINKVPQKLSS